MNTIINILSKLIATMAIGLGIVGFIFLICEGETFFPQILGGCLLLVSVALYKAVELVLRD